MNKLIVLMILTSLVVPLKPVLAEVSGETKINTKDLIDLAQRKTYRLGIRASMISPTSDILISKDSTWDLGLEFDARLNENLDTGPRFGVSSFKAATSGYDAVYSIIRFGYGARIYLTRGFANAYVAAEANYYTANKSSEIVLNSPSSFAGLGGQVGGGIEFAFGPNTGGFLQVDYLRTSINSASSQNLPLDGYSFSTGARLAFF